MKCEGCFLHGVIHCHRHPLPAFPYASLDSMGINSFRQHIYEIYQFLALPKYTGSAKFYCRQLFTNNNALKYQGKETPRNVKLQKQLKKSASTNSAKRKTIGGIYSRAITPPATFRRKKVIARRNSWPPVSPLKLTKRKKYQDLIKVKDFCEPFWMDTYEWLTMKCAPEKYKVAPLAKLTEFDDTEFVTYLEPEKNHNVNISIRNMKEKSLNAVPLSLSSSKISFYFRLDAKLKHVIEKRKYLQNLKSKCFVDSVCGVKPTNFSFLASNDNSNASLNNEYVVDSNQNHKITSEPNEALINFDDSFSPERTSFYVDNENSFSSQPFIPYQEIYRPITVPGSRALFRPLQSYNSSENSDVLALNIAPNLESHSLKQKVYLKDNFQNKENIKIGNFGFPNAKYPDHIDKNKKYTPYSQVGKKSQKMYELPQNKPASDKFIDTNKFKKDLQTLPKGMPNKSNKHDISSGDLQDMLEPTAPESKKSGATTGKDSTASSESSVSKSPGSVSEPQSGASTSSNSNQNNKPSMRQLFEQDIQSNFSMSSKVTKEKDENVKKEKSSDDNKSKKQEPKEETQIPAAVIGQSFLHTLIEQTKTQTEASVIPAAVIGQSFLKTLEEQASLVKTREKPIPAEVIGQSFIKNLLCSQSVPESSVDSSKSTGEEKSTTKMAAENVLPASVLGQTFLKSLIESQSTVQDDDCTSPPTSSTKAPPIPATVVGQEFLKSLIQDVTKLSIESDDPKVVPATVVSQSFLKTLLEQKLVETEGESKGVIPATVVGQTFLKNLIQMPYEAPKEETDSTKVIPAPVIEQSFIKSLLEQGTLDVKSDEPLAIPAPVVGQAFLKSLLESQANQPPESKAEAAIPSSVLAQAFLKSLISSESSAGACEFPTSTEQKEKVIPAPVVSQSFLKSLIQEQKPEEVKESPIPASVIGQIFAKALLESETSTKTEEEKTSIPASVVAQSFLKTLVSEAPESQVTEAPIPASVISQTFMKALLQEVPSSQPEKSGDKPVPSSVVSQTFLKSLLDQTSSVQEQAKEQVIPSSVVGQAFLKSLLAEGVSAADESVSSESQSKEPKVIPASVVGQSFLSSLLSQAPAPAAEAQKDVIPASVVGLAFLKTLTEEAKPVSEPTTPVVEDPTQQTEIKPIPATVVGQAFLKTLFSMSGEALSSPSTSASEEVPHMASSKDIEKIDCGKPNGCSNGCSASESTAEASVFSDDQCSIIPPPPEFCGEPEGSSHSSSKSSSSQTAGTSKVELPSSIIEELLSCTKVMQSVIESMKETEPHQSTLDSTPGVSDVSKKEKP